MMLKRELGSDLGIFVGNEFDHMIRAGERKASVKNILARDLKQR